MVSLSSFTLGRSDRRSSRPKTGTPRSVLCNTRLHVGNALTTATDASSSTGIIHAEPPSMDGLANPLKRALRDGRPQIGLWSSLTGHITAEVLGGAGFDFLVLDTEHAPS